MSRATIHVSIDEELLDRIEKLVDDGQLSKSEIVRRTLEYGIDEMEQAINRFIGDRQSEIESDRCLDLAEQDDKRT